MDITNDRTAVIILAAGKGTRMKSDKAKVLHELSGKPMIYYVVEAARIVAGDDVVVVVGHQREQVKEAVLKTSGSRFAVQDEQNGTGHAVMCALPEVPKEVGSIVVLCGDVPLIKPETIQHLIAHHETEECAVTLLAVNVDNPTGYGRIITGPDGNVVKIVEEADANDTQKNIKTVNAGIYCINHDFLKSSLTRIKSDNAQGELYLTDIIEIAHMDHQKIGMCVGPSPNEVIGINTCDDLNKVQNLISCNEL